MIEDRYLEELYLSIENLIKFNIEENNLSFNKEEIDLIKEKVKDYLFSLIIKEEIYSLNKVFNKKYNSRLK